MGKKLETVADFFLGSKIIVDGDCSHEIKRYLFLGRKAMTNLGSVLKSRGITLLTMVCIVKAMFFPVVMYGCESWTIKKAEPRRIHASKLWCWRRLLRVFWTARSNQSILKEINLNIHWKDWWWTDVPIFCPPDVQELTLWRKPWCWERWGQEEKRATEDEMVG